MPTNEQPDFDEEFAKAVAEWRDKHRLREDDAVIHPRRPNHEHTLPE
jgi:hypothetical protein